MSQAIGFFISFTMDSIYQGLHIGAMATIFVISLLAVSFPALSQRVRFLSIPKIVFFVGKHFGTGVILSTAFCHLLQDSFEALMSNAVKSHYPGVGKRTGFIILGSLLAIFLVEYIITSYVDHLHEETEDEILEAERPISSHPADERTHLLSSSFASAYPGSRHSRSLSHYSLSHSHDTKASLPVPEPHYLSSVVGNSPRHSRSNGSFYIINDLNYHLKNGEYHLVGGKGQCVCVCVCPAEEAPHGQHGLERSSVFPSPEESTVIQRGAENTGSDGHETQKIWAANRRRQVVALIFLQCGIMIHSLVIGLTLSITSGAQFTTLVTAIIFHQLFEGLSLGIRIAAIPPSDGYSSARPSSPSTNGARSRSTPSHHSWLMPILTFLFSITTPVGIALGLVVFSSRTRNSDESRIFLTQGLMSAISAGMLIYAATVEMLAGDFVFGTLGGGGTGSGHSHGGEFIDDNGSAGTEMEEGVPVRRKALALISLLAGVAAMGAIE
ncbi:ZIP zinc transporter-domain-containing protein [Rhodocollybia butyracea]|uniref:ZIP zinc transporter-domain-containing protein n=1 Tax=Rhodocollybia butyracea TaxID=206335 RepID=A0A9P5UAY1_9AGAR|nr:ZIP zinc transporter-domain-containing protein [Rhodocollybia butyracea]